MCYGLRNSQYGCTCPCEINKVVCIKPSFLPKGPSHKVQDPSLDSREDLELWVYILFADLLVLAAGYIRYKTKPFYYYQRYYYQRSRIGDL